MPLKSDTYERFISEAVVELTGASEGGVKQALYSVLREFTEDSNVWTEIIPFTVAADTTEYLLVPREDGVVLRLIGVRDHNQKPVPAFMPVRGTVTLAYPQNTAPPADWEAKVSKVITQPTTAANIPIFDDALFNQFWTIILDGVIGKMMMQPQKSYSSQTGATYHLRRFRTGIQTARVAVQRQNSVGAQTWTYPQQFRVRGQRPNVSTSLPRW